MYQYEIIRSLFFSDVFIESRILKEIISKFSKSFNIVMNSNKDFMMETVTTFRALPTAKKQWIRDKQAKKDFLVYTLNEIIHSASILGESFSHLNHPCLLKYSHSTSNQIFFRYPTNMVQLNRSPDLDQTAQLKIIIGLACALNELHKNNIVHGNLSFSSVFVNNKGKIQLSDFGLFGNIPNHNLNHSFHLRFQAPELQFEAQQPTSKSDVYSFGVFVYKLVANENPFNRNIRNSVLERGPPIHNGKIPEKLMSFILLCFQKVPKLRPSMEEITKFLMEDGMDLPKASNRIIEKYKKIVVPKNILYSIIDKRAKEYQKKADKGEGPAMVRCGDLYLEEEDLENAAKYYQMAANIGNRDGFWKIGNLLEQGKGVRQNKTEAFRYYEKASRLDAPNGLYHHGRVLRLGIGCQCDSKLALGYLQRAAKAGVNDSYYLLSEIVSGKEKEEYLKQASDSGNPQAQYKVGIKMFNEGKKESNNVKINEAIKLLHNSAKANIGEGLLEYGKFIFQGKPEKGFDMIYKAAHEHNIPEAAYLIGEQYLNGQMLPKNEEAAAKYFRIAAKKRYPEALYRFAVCLESGIGTEVKHLKAARYLSMAAQANVSAALFLMGQKYLEKNQHDIALNYIKQAADLKLPEAVQKYAELTMTSSNTNPLLTSAPLSLNAFHTNANMNSASAYSTNPRPNLNIAAPSYTSNYNSNFNSNYNSNFSSNYNSNFSSNYNSNFNNNLNSNFTSNTTKNDNQSAESQFLLGRKLLNNGTDEKQGLELIKSAADNGDILAMHELGTMYFYGNHVPQSGEYSLYYLRNAADRNHVESALMLYQMLKDGRGTQKNLQLAIHYCKKAASLNNNQAMFELGAAYQQGVGVVQNINEAAKYYKLSADLGNQFAQYSFGACLELGAGTTKSLQEALRYYSASAQQNMPQSQYAVGRFLERGLGINENREDAILYYRASAQGGCQDAIQRLQELHLVI
ncbi:hypothetical protein TRFO_13364 [Tritrichomonas foetus]|uniref:Protein kinase domain-containing protein n=1 Tax=Tritrichomonas foetus TaxID=1144522 RepID=A0A1J4L2T3_9EUKA|nr:hypothetical protein TRFO_13364 [Tritrichomonas foetus]|eukprot:OHT16205.1 hypothetical protein TRFO_13364 [Tritrichomonas foetus]